ncbi:LysM peptidoglycan-binding domain-containing protein [Methylocystis sp. L43]|jgi:LysM repeat protein|uniref:LysM peptidoglycan-binding domain-containing protein n=1 Tax=unclassified Methylocystis TaxID=2625913 RepID=UPI0018C3224C|nr:MULTISPECIES: LysM peptidoglycan-binding domain-containing protein [unclassified Methylocystis]MBG0796777.1 LysM peptidoglycan-binding domain-containing protein [Methylocystis sp. L43]MBG0806776.1 LysM peptidoglycan-binding domain-containing protein [Methylocystis sp. H15]
MNSNLSTAYAAVILMAALAAALPFHLSRILGPQRLLHAAYAAAALGLFYLLGATAFGWTFEREGALLWIYLAFFLLAAGIAARRRMTFGAIGLPWLSALIQLGVVAYMFAPDSFRKPPVTAALFLYFLFEALVWLRGREAQEPAESREASYRARPPLFPPPRRRGFAEASLAAAAIAIAFLLVAGPQAAHIGPESDTAQQQEAQTEETAASGETASSEEPASEANPSASNELPNTESRESAPADAPQAVGQAPVEPSATAAKDPGVYTARAGDTFKSIARRLYGATSKWRAIAERNPDLKSKKLRAGQLVNLPSAPTR